MGYPVRHAPTLAVPPLPHVPSLSLRVVDQDIQFFHPFAETIGALGVRHDLVRHRIHRPDVVRLPFRYYPILTARHMVR